MLDCKEPNGTIQRTVCVTIRPTVTEIADAIQNLDIDEQVILLGCLKRRLCKSDADLTQHKLVVTKTVSNMTTEKSDEVKDFVRYLVDCVFGETML